MSTIRYEDALSGRVHGEPPPGELLWVEGDAERGYLFGPALFDPQVNGFAGVDFQDPRLDGEALEHAVSEIRRAGCSHFLLTLITQSAEALEAQLARVSTLLEASPRLTETVAGIHLEGPFLSPKPGYTGAHPGEHLRTPDWELFQRLQRASGGRIRMITLAPELPGAVGFIARASAGGVCVALGHSDASMAELEAATRAGARLFTHLGNACPLELPRHDNIIQRVLATPALMATLIPDGLHVPAPALGNLAAALGPARLAFTTDAMSAAAAPPGRYPLGPLLLEVGTDGIVLHPSGRHFAGSSLRMVDGLRRAVRLGGLTVAAAWRGWTMLRDRILPTVAPPTLVVPVSTLAEPTDSTAVLHAGAPLPG